MIYFAKFLFLTIGLFNNLKTPIGNEVLLVTILFSTRANSKLPPPRSATNPLTFSKPIFTPSAEHSASSSPDNILILVLKSFSTSLINGFVSVASLKTAVATILRFVIFETFKISENLFKTFKAYSVPDL